MARLRPGESSRLQAEVMTHVVSTWLSGWDLNIESNPQPRLDQVGLWQ